MTENLFLTEKKFKWLLRALASLITYLCSKSLSSLGEPKPHYIAVSTGVFLAFVLTAGIWMSTFNAAFRFPRFVVLYLIPTGALATLTMFDFSVFFVVAVATIYLWCIARLLLVGTVKT